MNTNTVRVIAVLAGFALSHSVQGVNPPPDGGYAGGNTAEGQNALFSLSGGGYNTAVGWFSLRANTTNYFNTAIGAGALLSNAADGNTATGAAALFSSGHLGTVGSSSRFKNEIRPMAQASEAILGLKPVTFHYKKEIDPAGASQFGLVAEDVEKVNPGLIVRDKDGKPYSVRYDQVNAMLLNEFSKEHQTVQELKKQVAELTAGLQKLSAQLEVNNATRQKVLNEW